MLLLSTSLTIYGLKIDKNYSSQPILITTASGGYLVQCDPLRFFNASIGVVNNIITGVYPLHGLIKYTEPADLKIIESLKNLVKKEPISKFVLLK